MSVGLMHVDRDVDLSLPVPAHAEDLHLDLRLGRLLDVAAGPDPQTRAVLRHALLVPLAQVSDVLHRQAVLEDVLADPETVTMLHQVATDALRTVEHLPASWLSPDHPSAALKRSVDVMRVLTASCRRLYRLATTHRHRTRSDAVLGLLDRCRRDFDDQYLDAVDEQLDLMAFPDGLRLQATLGPGARLCLTAVVPPRAPSTWWHDLIPHHDGPGSSVVVAHDEQGRRAWADIHDSGLAPLVSVVDDAVRQAMTFMQTLAVETGFYVGASRLCSALATRGAPLSFPELSEDGSGLRAMGLRDPHMLLGHTPVVGNDVDARATPLVVITGANGGGKSTLLRAIGLAQLMGQAGLPVAAESMTVEMRPGVFTHFARDEDRSLQHGRLDDELARMSAIVDSGPAGCLILLNETFASTYEREGAQIAADIVRGLLASGSRVVYVTHQYDLACRLLGIGQDVALSLRAGRCDDGRRTFQVRQAPPRPTSHADDVWASVFGS